VAGYEIVGSRVMAQTPSTFLTMVEVDVRAPDGEHLTRHIVEHPGAVVVVPIEHDDVAVLVRQWRVATGGLLLEVPAGKRDVAGEAPERTAARELGEELGMRAGRMAKIAECYLSPGFCSELAHVFVALDLEPISERAELRAEERDMTVERVPLDAVETLIASGELRDAKSIVGLLLGRAYVRGQYDGIGRSAP
jgi:ADP-ribose pyrophosphatase